MSVTQILLIRHGETDWNVVKRFQGHIDIALNATGLAQAQLLASALADHAIDVIYSSDLQRAHVTAQAIAEQKQLAVQLTPQLRERHYGIFEGLTGAEIESQHPEHFPAWIARDPQHQIPKGESLQAFYDRITSVLIELAQQHPAQTIVVVAHGGVLDCIYRHATKTALHEPRKAPLLNTSLNRLRYANGALEIVQWGDVSHLQTQARDEIGPI
ncbi:histidine phosphatase family protein [Ampullimonas aquatilis]|uniref:histidine phosphatase family protein n=1 Tax=Ampullimonas aquatilis TaxID=1341549 RepID=UPI003C711A56